MSYTPPDSKLVEVSFVGAYTPPDTRLVSIDLVPPPTGSTQVVYPNAIGDYGAGAPSIQNTARALYPAGADTAVFGTLATANLSRAITADGFTAAAFGTPEKVWNFHTFVRGVSVGETGNSEQTHAVRNQREYLRLFGAGHSLYGQPEMSKEDRGIHALIPLHAVGNLAAETYSPTCVAGGYGFFSGYSLLYDDSNGSTIKEYFWARVDYPSLTNPVKVPYTGSGRIDPYGRSTVTTDGSYLYTFHVDVSNGGTSTPTLSKRDFDYNVISQVTLSTSRALGSVFVIDGRLYLHTDMSALLIEEIDKNTLAPISACPVSFSESSTSDGAYIYLNYSNRRVAIFDPASNSIIGTTPTIVTPEQNGIITTHRNIVYAIGVQDKIWACMYERDEDPNATITGWRSFLLVYDRTTLTLEQTQDLRALTYSPSVATTLRRAGNYVIATPNGPRGDAWYYVFDASTAKPLGGFPGLNVPEEAFNNPVYEGTVPAVDAASITTRLGRAARGSFSIGPFGYGFHTQYEWLFPTAAAFPNGTLLLSVIKACDTAYDIGQLLSVHESTPAATIAMRVHVENVLVETLSPSGIAPPTMDSRPSIRVQWQIVTPASTGHTALGEPFTQLKNRQVGPLGVDPGLFGDVALRSNLLRPAGFDALSVTIPDVTDKRQYAFPASVLESAIMGDLPHIWNFSAWVTPDSTDHSYFANFQPVVENWTKEARPIGYDAGRWGAAQITNKAVALYPEGLDATVYGTSDTTHRHQYRTIVGTDMALFGDIIIANAQLAARPNGKDALVFGEPVAGLKQREITFAGVDSPTQDSEPWVSLYLRSFGVFGGIGAPAVPPPDVAHDVRHLYPQTFLPATFGQTTASLARRTVYPEGVFFQTPAAAFGPPRLSSFIQTITLQGQEFGLVEVPGIARNEVAVDQLTLGIQTVFGTTQAELSRRYIQMFTTDTARYGEPVAWNWRTYVSTWSPAMPDAFGTPTAEQRNKQLNPLGYDMARVSAYADISNNARLMEPTGDDLSQFGAVLVADRIRHTAPSGDDLSTFGVWFTVTNARQVIDTSGIPRPYAGVPRVWRNEQLLDAIGCGRTDEIGGVLIAPRIRTITQYRYADPDMGFPTVDLHIQYVAPQGFAERFGWATVEHFRNEARIFGINYARYGEPLVQNFNPQAWVAGIDMPPLPAAPWVSFRVRQIDLAGQAVGEYQPNRPAIEFRTRTVAPRGYALDVIPRTHDIRWDIPQIAPTQRVAPDGIGSPQIPTPFVGATIIFPESTDQLRCGLPELAANSIWPTSGLSVFSFVAAPMVSLRNRTIFVRTTQLPAVFDPSRVVISPYVVGPFGDIRADWLIDARLAERDREFDRPFFGTATVTNSNRAITTLGANHGVWGLPALATNNMAPDGWDSNEGKFGMADFAGPLYIAPYWGRTTEDYTPEIPAYNFDTALYGAPDLAYPVIPPVWSPYLLPAGLHSFDSGRPFVESTIRNVYPAGIEYDGDDEGWIPNVWLHPPFHLYPESAVPPDPAIAQIAFRIREVLPQGDDSAVVCEEDAQMISARFRVRNGASRYVLGGIAPEAPAILQITHRNRGVAAGAMPEGVTSPARVQAQNIVVPTGVDAAQLGIIRRAVYGELYPYAPDTALYGYPKTNRRAYTGGIAAPAVADIRIARPLRPQGADCAGAGGAAVTNPYGCRDRVIIVGGDTDFSTFGGAHATN